MLWELMQQQGLNLTIFYKSNYLRKFMINSIILINIFLFSVRVSNELGAGHPRTAKFSVVVVVITSFFIGVFLSLILIITRKQYPSAFTNSNDVKRVVYALTPLLATSIVINNVQPVLSGILTYFLNYRIS